MEGQTSIVTGGGGGIGRAVALALGRAGHAVCVNDTGVALDGTAPDPQAAEAVADEIREAGGEAFAVSVDARKAVGAHELIAEATSWAGRAPSVLVHAAGTLRDAMVHKLSDEDWSVVLASHLSVAVELTRAMAPGLRRHGYGRIVYMGSAAGLVGSIGQANYAVAKAGLWGLTRAVALEMAGRDVCVNYLIPFGWTRMTESIPPANGQLRAYLRDAPRSKPDHIAPVVAWLCSKAAAGISGQIVGARGAELTVWSQPRPALRLVDTSGWDAAALDAARPQIDDHLLSLQSQFDLFGGPPIPVEDAHQSDPSFDAGDPTNPS